MPLPRNLFWEASVEMKSGEGKAEDWLINHSKATRKIAALRSRFFIHISFSQLFTLLLCFLQKVLKWRETPLTSRPCSISCPGPRKRESLSSASCVKRWRRPLISPFLPSRPLQSWLGTAGSWCHAELPAGVTDSHRTSIHTGLSRRMMPEARGLLQLIYRPCQSQRVGRPRLPCWSPPAEGTSSCRQATRITQRNDWMSSC